MLPTPLPVTLVSLTPDEVAAFDAAWPRCGATLPDAWTVDDLAGCLAEALSADPEDPRIQAVASWISLHRDDVAQPLPAARQDDPPPPLPALRDPR